MPETFPGNFTQALDQEIDGWIRELAEHIYMRAILSPSQRTRVQAEVEILVTDLRNGVNAFLNNGGSVTLTAGTGSPFSFTGSFDSATLIVLQEVNLRSKPW